MSSIWYRYDTNCYPPPARIATLVLIRYFRAMAHLKRATELIERLARLVTSEGHSHGLKPAQWNTLRYLARANRFSRTPGALTTYLGATKGTVSQTVMSLERAGLVDKQPHPIDRRSVLLALSPAGRRMLDQDELLGLDLSVSTLPPDSRADLEAALSDLLKMHLQANGGRPFGICRDCRHFEPDAGGEGAHFCRLLGEPLSDADSAQICLEQEAA